MAPALLAVPGSALAHRRQGGLGAFFGGAPGSEAFSLVMSLVILGMIAVLLGVIFYFRWRAAHPLPEPDSVRSVVGDGEGDPSSVSRSSPSSGPPTWEKPGDWWKPDSGDGDETAG